MINRLDPGIDRGALKTSRRNALCMPEIHLSLHVLFGAQLIAYLPRYHHKRKPKRSYRKTGEQIKNRISVALRPLAATVRRECGHWEVDMIVAGDRQHGLNVLVDGKSRLTHIRFLGYKTAAATKKVMLRRLKGYPGSLTQSMTYDTGRENTLHEGMNKALGTEPLFCAPITVGRKAVWNRSMG